MKNNLKKKCKNKGKQKKQKKLDAPHYYVVKTNFAVRTRKQAVELNKELKSKFRQMVAVWCGNDVKVEKTKSKKVEGEIK